MKENELRIGNLVSRLDLGDHSLRVESVLELRKDKVLTTGPISVICLYSETKPIPLSEEWLLKFGFNDGFTEFQINNFTIAKDNDLFYYQFENYQVEIPDIKLKYVHQLQNLYFALTGEELELKVDALQ